MRGRWYRIAIVCSLLAGLSDLWIGATSPLPHSWIRVVTGGIMLLTSAGWLYVWAKSRA
jgi:hypothetical protein